ncbi:MAG: D-tyrosyl-tRNA(Tyr) deacylase [Deltaproteobacteria bacterium]|jgi:D-tyrosyl-tRNA(Tyr) deacylase|nr:D-tyrosyl-tRNA(Tyr) deacylase [Deltaproteobacteria bacterium]
MRLVVQRVTQAAVEVDGEEIGKIGPGFMTLVGVADGDDKSVCDWLGDKLLALRVFADGSGKMNLPITEIGGSILLISQFTLLGDCRRGRRPDFTKAAPPKEAENLFGYLGERLSAAVPVAYGRFGAHMSVSLVNDGPVTLILEKSPA